MTSNFRNENYIPDLCEIVATETQGGSEFVLPLNVEVQFGHASIDTEGVSISYAIKKACLKVDVQNGEIVRRTKFANDQKPHSVQLSIAHDAEVKSEGNVSVKGMFGWAAEGVSAQLGGGVDQRKAVHKSQQEAFTEIFERVQSLPGGRWEIQEVRGKYLRGRYLGVENVCDLEIDRDGGLVAIDVSFCVSDLVILNCARITKKGPVPINDKAVRSVIDALVKKDLRRIGAEFVISHAALE